jgi:hypothetical protein
MGNVINVLDKEYAVSRVPAGLRPGHPLELLWNYGRILRQINSLT